MTRFLGLGLGSSPAAWSRVSVRNKRRTEDAVSNIVDRQEPQKAFLTTVICIAVASISELQVRGVIEDRH